MDQFNRTRCRALTCTKVLPCTCCTQWLLCLKQVIYVYVCMYVCTYVYVCNYALMYMYVTMCMYVYAVMYTHFPQSFSEFNCIVEKEIIRDIREIWLEVILLDITKFELSPKLKSLYEEGTTCTSEGYTYHTYSYRTAKHPKDGHHSL